MDIPVSKMSSNIQFASEIHTVEIQLGNKANNVIMEIRLGAQGAALTLDMSVELYRLVFQYAQKLFAETELFKD